MKFNPCKNQLYNYRNRTAEYSGNPKNILYRYIRTPYNRKYEPQKSYIREFYNGDSSTLSLAIGII